VTHRYDLPAPEALLRYRSSASAVDEAVARRYWEAAWLEGARSPLLDALRRTSEQQRTEHRRSVVVLASEDDARARISSQEFLPVAVLPGILDDAAPAAWRYGAVRGRVREQTARLLASRLELYRGRALVVLGAREATDLDLLYEVLEDRPIADLEILLVWPVEKVAPKPENAAVRVHIWPGTEEELASQLDLEGAPLAEEVPEWSLRVGSKVVKLTARDLARISDRFVLLTERELSRPSQFTLPDLVDFLEGNLVNWKAYTSGLPAPRAYTTDKNLSLENEVLGALKGIESDASDNLTLLIKVPAESGAGITTLMRGVAFSAASTGYPALILRPDQVEPDLEELLAFATQLQESSLAVGLAAAPPLLIVLDVEHARSGSAGQIPALLSSHGRKAVILQATPEEADQQSPRRGKRVVRLPTLRGAVTDTEVATLRLSLSELVTQWQLPMEVPPEDRWQAYQRATRWYLPSEEASLSLFWVALRFFLIEGMSLEHATRVQDALGVWIGRRAERIADPTTQSILAYVAALSSFRIVSPVWTVLRSLTAGAYSSELSSALQELGTLVKWEGPVPDLDDYVLRFSHPALADEYLRQRNGIETPPGRVTVLRPLMMALSPGHPGDVWVAEVFSARVLAPLYDERQSAGWDWRLSAFDAFPPAVAESSKTILHHWARCLYLSADMTSGLPQQDRRARMEAAIDKLIRATQLPRRVGRDEHPSHLYNSLGTAYVRLARLLHETESADHEAEREWQNAWTAFEQSIDLSGGTNVEALLAFSHRLIAHAREPVSPERRKERAEEVLQAIELLDEAEELISDHASPDPDWSAQIAEDRSDALSWLDERLGADFVENLKRSADAELGYLCEARKLLGPPPQSTEALQGALSALDRAESNGVILGARTLRFRASLLARNPSTRFDFQRLLGCYVQLERAKDYSFRPSDLFRHAVLCYQTGQYAEGSERFRRLREYLRREGTFPLRLHDFWRDPTQPDEPRITQIRVARVTAEWRADGYVAELAQSIPMRPRHFSPPPRQGDIVACAIRFEMNGPLAVPPRFIVRRTALTRDQSQPLS